MCLSASTRWPLNIFAYSAVCEKVFSLKKNTLQLLCVSVCLDSCPLNIFAYSAVWEKVCFGFVFSSKKNRNIFQYSAVRKKVCVWFFVSLKTIRLNCCVCRSRFVGPRISLHAVLCVRVSVWFFFSRQKQKTLLVPCVCSSIPEPKNTFRTFFLRENSDTHSHIHKTYIVYTYRSCVCEGVYQIFFFKKIRVKCYVSVCFCECVNVYIDVLKCLCMRVCVYV